MSRAVPWSVAGVGFDAREAVSESARRDGMGVSEWLAHAIGEYAASIGVSPHELTEEECVQALARKIGPAPRRAPEPQAPRRWDSDQVLNELQARFPAPRQQLAGARSNVDALIQDLGRRIEPGAPATDRRKIEPSEASRIELDRLASLTAKMRRTPSDGAPAVHEKFDGARRAAVNADLSTLLDAVAALCREASQAQNTAQGSADAQEVAELKRDMGVLLGAIAHLQHAASGAKPGAAIEDMRRKVAEISRTVANLGPAEDVAALDHSVRALSKRVASSRKEGLRESIVEPIEGLLVDLKRTLADLNPAETLGAIERQIFAMVRQLEHVARTGAGADAIGRMSDQIAEIHGLLAQASKPVRLDHIEAQIADLAGRIDRIAERGSSLAGERAVAECVETIRAELNGGLQKGLFLAVEERIESLSRKIDETIAKFPAKRLDDIHERLEEMQRTFAQQGLRSSDAARLEERMRTLQERLDRPDQSAAELVQLNSLVGQLARRVEQAIATGTSPDSLGVIERQVNEIVTRLDQQARGGPDAERLEGLLRAVAERLDQPLSPQQLEQVHETVRLLSQNNLSVGGSPDSLHAIEKQLAEISARLAEPVSVDFDTTRLETLIYDMSDRVSAAVGGNSAELQQTLGRIVSTVDELGRTSGGAEALRALESQIAEIAARLDEPVSAELDTSRLEAMVERLGQRLDDNHAGDQSDGAETLAGLERSVADIFQHIEQFRETAILTAEHAARKAAREALASVAPPPRVEDPQARVALEREFADIRSRQSAADQRTNVSLGAVQSTLDQVVDRLSAIERTSERASTRASAPQPEARQPEGRQHEAPFAPVAAAQPFLPPPVKPFTPHEPVPAPAREPLIAPPRAMIEPPPRDEAGALNDLLLEPGAGKPVSSGVVMSGLGAPAEKGAESGPRASFIAAVRRAQSAAASAQGGEIDSPTRGESALDQTRARARAAANKTQDTSPERVRTNGKFGALVAKIARISLFLAIGAGLLLGAGKFGLSILEEAEPPLEQSALPPPAAPVNNKTNLSAFGEPEQKSRQAASAQTAAPLAAAREQNVDPASVASIDPRQSVNAKPQDLRTAAGNGLPLAQFEIAVRYAEGRGVARNLAQAVAWFERAAQQEFAPAQYRLGALYEKGIGVERDLEKARSWYQRAAERGNVKAMHNLAVLIAEGAAGKPDYANAAQWFRSAAEHGVRDSQYNFAILNARGLGTAQDMVQSYVWFSLAAAQGDEDASKKRADVAARLDARQLSKARAIVDNFAPKRAGLASNDFSPPPGGWDFTPEPSKSDAPKSEGAKPAQQRPGAARARVSRL
jgi:localization factor PodJL